MSASAFVYVARFECRKCGGHFRGIRAITESNAWSIGQEFDRPRVVARREICVKQGHNPGPITESVEEVS